MTFSDAMCCSQVIEKYWEHTVRGLLQRISQEMEVFMQQLQQRVVVGLVGGSDLIKISEQMSSDNKPGENSGFLLLSFFHWAVRLVQCVLTCSFPGIQAQIWIRALCCHVIQD